MPLTMDSIDYRRHRDVNFGKKN